MEKSALEFVDEYLKKEAAEIYEDDGFVDCFAECIAWENNLICHYT